jgi:hypothetical protein
VSCCAVPGRSREWAAGPDQCWVGRGDARPTQRVEGQMHSHDRGGHVLADAEVLDIQGMHDEHVAVLVVPPSAGPPRRTGPGRSRCARGSLRAGSGRRLPPPSAAVADCTGPAPRCTRGGLVPPRPGSRGAGGSDPVPPRLRHTAPMGEPRCRRGSKQRGSQVGIIRHPHPWRHSRSRGSYRLRSAAARRSAERPPSAAGPGCGGLPEAAPKQDGRLAGGQSCRPGSRAGRLPGGRLPPVTLSRAMAAPSRSRAG